MKLKEYKGPSGPTEEQTKNNTLWVAEKLAKLNVQCKVLPLYKAPGMSDAVIDQDSVTVKVGRYWIDYDRWGFIVQRSGTLVHDQIRGKDLLVWLRSKFVK